MDPRPSALDHPPDWKPAASRDVIRLRAEILARIRGFFAEREVLEVETPLLSAETVTDPHIHSLTTRCKLPGGEGELYLQTSPEFAMKRLLAAGSGSIYQVCKAFRDGEAGSAHNPEFTILEWYRVGFDHHLLMDEVDELLRVLGISEQPAERLMYREAFNRFGGCDPFQAAEEELSALATESGLVSEGANGLDRDGLLDFLFSQLVQPSLAGQRPYFIHSYPSSQAALARINPDAPAVADRFELFFQGVELGNGYHELADSVELRSRFSTDLAKRAALGMPAPQPGEHFLSAMTYGLPDCAGVAVGVDRLVMLAAGLNDVRQVMTFPVLQA
ncbi:MAG: EF-P lysine aminoacylase GenX [Gammaproteobacteria bacterium]|nr:EF-P lysine aminoacylase GenX [Gammaproteobacteria bacterium]